MNYDGVTSNMEGSSNPGQNDEGYEAEFESQCGGGNFDTTEDVERSESFEPANDESEMIGDSSVHYDGVQFSNLREEHLLRKEFKSVEEAENFYRQYAKVIGFDVRKDSSRMNRNGLMSMRRLVCSKQGTRAAKFTNARGGGQNSRKRAVTRVGCFACFRVNYVAERKCYAVTEFNPLHSHPLFSPAQASYLPSNQIVSDPALAQAAAKRKASIRTVHSYDFMVDQCGGYVNIGFTMKDLYNKLDEKRRAIVLEGDAEAALSYMNAKATTDPEYFCKFSVDAENRLANLFWRDSNSLVDYSCFGDILILDSTYKTNRYGKPLVFFVGVNNHREIVVFGSALLANETSDTYAWVLRTFLSSMKGKKPISVVTDGDEAIMSAIDVVLQDCRHQLSAWHVGKNAKHNLQSTELVGQFKRCMYGRLSPEEFEHCWKQMVETYGLKDDDWLNMMHGKRHRWADVYLRGHFFGGLQSSQQCECINHCMKDFLRRNGLKVFECIPQLDRALMGVRNKYVIDEVKGKNSSPVLTTELRSLEQHAATIFTAKVFERIQTQLKEVGSLISLPALTFGDKFVVNISKYGEEGRMWTVGYRSKDFIDLHCTCKMYESEGIPCSHLFCVMRNEQMRHIPDSLIMKRWTKGGRSEIEVPLPVQENEKAGLQVARYVALSGLCNRLCYFGSMSTEGYAMVKSEFLKLSGKVEEIWKNVEASNISPGRHVNIVRDPDIFKTKGKRMPVTLDGAAKRKDCQCGLSKEFGHTRQNCKAQGPQREDEECVDVNYASPELDDFDEGVASCSVKSSCTE